MCGKPASMGSFPPEGRPLFPSPHEAGCRHAIRLKGHPAGACPARYQSANFGAATSTASEGQLVFSLAYSAAEAAA